MKAMQQVELHEMMAARNGSVNPAMHPDEEFDLYSIPAFDRGEPDVVHGRDIGSTKQVVESGDVLLSKIVPHIRRAWIVERPKGRRLIASSEWIVFRSERTHPQYLRHVLTCDDFHIRFMGTVAGVGGSLLRARPSHVAKLKIPLPYPDDPKRSLAEQKRIAAILDKADAIRRRRHEATCVTDQLIPSLFYDMFGDPSTNRNDWPIEPLSKLVDPEDKINYGVVQPGDDFAGGVPIVRVGDFKNKRICRAGLKRIDPKIEAQYRRSRLRGDEVLVACVGSIGLVALADNELKGNNVVRAVARVRCGPRLDRVFLAYYLSTARIQGYFRTETRTVSQPTLNIAQIESTPTFRPPIELQRKFSKRAGEVDAHRTRGERQAEEGNAMFNSLVQRAFRGEL